MTQDELKKKKASISQAQQEWQARKASFAERISQLEHQLQQTQTDLQVERQAKSKRHPTTSAETTLSESACEKKTTFLSELRARLEESLSLVDIAQSEAQASFTKAQQLSAAQQAQLPECAICMDRPVAVCLVPCGHLWCGKCADSVPACPQCRRSVEERVKVFLA